MYISKTSTIQKSIEWRQISLLYPLLEATTFTSFLHDLSNIYIWQVGFLQNFKRIFEAKAQIQRCCECSGEMVCGLLYLEPNVEKGLHYFPLYYISQRCYIDKAEYILIQERGELRICVVICSFISFSGFILLTHEDFFSSYYVPSECQGYSSEHNSHSLYSWKVIIK